MSLVESTVCYIIRSIVYLGVFLESKIIFEGHQITQGPFAFAKPTKQGG